MSIRHKLFLLFVALVLGPFAVYTAILIRQQATAAERAGRYAATQVLAQATEFVNARMAPARRSVAALALDPALRALCDADPLALADLSVWNQEAERLRQLAMLERYHDPDVSGAVFYMARGLAAGGDSREFRPLAAERDRPWLRRIERTGARVDWFSSRWFAGEEGPEQLHAVARVQDELDLGRTVGFVRFDVPRRALEEILDQARFSASSSAFLLDDEGEPVALSERARGPDRAYAGALHVAAARAGPGAGPQELERDGRRWLVSWSSVQDAGWRLYLLVPYEDVDAFGDAVRRQMLAALAIILPLTLPLAYWAASRSTRRIARLAAGIRAYARGELGVKVPGEGGDELGRLVADVNRMADRIAGLLDESYGSGLERKHLEMRALQAQINPHFLYNTLDLVNCLALRHGAPEITEAVEALARFYRLSLSGGAEVVTLAQELTHVELYVRVQNMRFDDGIALELDVPAALRPLPFLKIVLQPLVENAILHGIREKPSARGRVRVSARREGGELRVEVADDGVGMTPGRLAEVLDGRHGPDHGYGVHNIDRRLRVQYGEAHGLSFTSAPGEGTTVTVRLPCPWTDDDAYAGGARAEGSRALS